MVADAEGTPLRVRVLLQRCLQKEPKQRLRDIGDARISIDEAISGAPLEAATPNELGWTRTRQRQTILWSIACLIIAVIAGLVVWILKPTPLRPDYSRCDPIGCRRASGSQAWMGWPGDPFIRREWLAYVATTGKRLAANLSEVDGQHEREAYSRHGGSHEPLLFPRRAMAGLLCRSEAEESPG